MATSLSRVDSNLTLDDKYSVDEGRVFITGTQALVRLTLMQRQRDLAAGLNTAGFVSGYRGSPLGGLDQAMWRARPFLKSHHVNFQPGVNEDLAATAIWGTQQVNLFEGARYDGVYAMWYGKGPGVDRCGDVFRHGNLAGTSRHGGVLLLAGDDHAGKSSTVPHQSEHNFVSVMIPVLAPSSVQEFLDLGLYGWAMSRYSGCWVAFKLCGETVESSASVHVDSHRISIALPNDFEMPDGGLNIRWPDHWTDQEHRLQRHKAYAALAFARANRLDRVVMDSSRPRFGIVTTGKAYLDVLQALEDLGIDQRLAAEIGIRLYKVAMPWPLEREGARAFAEGLEEVLVVEEKRALIENQFKEQLYNWRADVRPRVVGKFDENRQWILPSNDELTPATIAKVIAARLKPFYASDAIKARVALIEQKEKQRTEASSFRRIPYFCSGCPHNTSTKVPEGSRALAGIGCHFMVLWMDRRTATFSHMGAEGAAWIGQSPFTSTPHVFTNMGDGTYFHSGLLAIRAAIAAHVNITYKILYNDAVAMTGGQPHDGQLSVPKIVAQVLAEGANRVVVTSDEPEKYAAGDFPAGVQVFGREKLDEIQCELREQAGVTVLVHDQTCAAEKRRRRKRGTFPDPDKRVFINPRVCEGCGDCGTASNCLSVTPIETEYGRKRAIEQSSCNKDFSCVNGFCPSFVTVHGARLRKHKPVGRDQDPSAILPEPKALPALDAPYNLLVTGVGGTGVVTIGALLGMAAHLEGKGVTVLDQTGLAQKGGAVHSHIRIAASPEKLNAVRIAVGETDALIGCDLVVSGSVECLDRVALGRTRGVVNTQESPTGEFTRQPDQEFPAERLREIVSHALGRDHVEFVDAQRMATLLLGDAINTNPFMLGYAWQRGLVPVSRQAIERAIELNAVAVEINKLAFAYGRLAAHDPLAIERLIRPRRVRAPQTLDELLAARMHDLTAYQNAAYARRYEDLVRRVARAESERVPGRDQLAMTVARYAYKLMAFKDEFEVARLYSDGAFQEALKEQFESWDSLEFHLAPPIVAERDARTGHLKKRSFGPWMMRAFGVLAALRRWRGSIVDVFSRSEERKTERKLIADYEMLLGEIMQRLSPANHALAVQLAAIPEKIRGYGHVKEEHLAKAKAEEATLLKRFRTPTPAPSAQAAE
jgi:indolepyruvate ferredoxin oxidoreductase